MNPVGVSASEKLTKLSETIFNQSVKDWKKQGKPVVGYLCTYIPEEIFYAAGILPYRIGARGCHDTSHADSLMATITCSYCRSCLELALTNEYGFLDGLVYMNGCESMRRMADNWRHKVESKFTHILSVPQRVDKDGIEWYKDELRTLMGKFEEIYGVKITDDKLKDAIQLCNRNRKLLKNFYELRKQNHPQVSGTDAHKITVMASAMPKEEYNKLLEEAITEIKQKQGISDYRARIMVVGNMLDDAAYTEIIEESGGLVVSDASCFGSLYFWEMVESTKDPLDGISNAYLDGVPCPRQPFKNAALAKFIASMVKEYKVDGIIFERMVHCGLWACETLSIEKDAQDMGIPLLILEREYVPSGLGQLKTRIQAFIEMIEGGKK